MLPKLIAKLLAKPAVTDWLIARAKRTPYYHLKGTNGTVYMERYWLFNPYPPKSDGQGKRWNWLPSIRLHRIMRRDLDDHMHDHPWNARTFILRGWYVERSLRDLGCTEVNETNARAAGYTGTLKFNQFHTITAVSPGGVWTLFVTWKPQGQWGFLVNGQKVYWKIYLGLERDR